MIAFAYCDMNPQMSAMYRTLAEGLTQNIRDVLGEKILFLTDENTPIVKGIHQILRIDRNVPLMTWRLKAHQMAHQMADEILFVEPDVRFVENPMDQMEGDFDIAITSREKEVMLNSERLNTPFTFGMTFSKNAEFWREAKIYCQTLSDKDQTWFGDMLSIAHVINGGKFNVKMLDGAIYNHVVNDPNKPTTAKVLHYKGKRKAWLFPRVTEAAA